MTLRRTLLELTQDVLVTLDGDDVTAITESVEASSVAAIIRQNYRTIVSTTEQEKQFGPFSLTSTSIASPNRLILPSSVLNINWLKYERRSTISVSVAPELLEYLVPEDFHNLQSAAVVDGINVGGYTYTPPQTGVASAFKYGMINPPMYYTVIGKDVFFDSIKESVEDTGIGAFATGSFTTGWGEYDDAWVHSDGFIPNLTEKQFEMLFQMSRAQANIDLKQAASADAEKKSKAARVSFNRGKHTKYGNTSEYYSDRLPNYGKK